MTNAQEHILETALECFTDKGFERTTLLDIAHRMGGAKAAIYHHYRSKADLIAATLKYAEQRNKLNGNRRLLIHLASYAYYTPSLTSFYRMNV